MEKSIPSNITEGLLRSSRKDFLRFLFIAYGSGAELQTQLQIARNLKFISDKDFIKKYIKTLLKL
ncbi:four helix bundle protein [Candidatus Nomurabacteria bacterium]|nr:four helix bundle protein [Candidatus Nomurabacteria bacterium]